MRPMLLALSAVLLSVPTLPAQGPGSRDTGINIRTKPEFDVDIIGDGSNNYLVTDDYIVRTAFEISGDLNGDGDQGDKVLHVFRQATGIETNLGLSTPGSPINFDCYKLDGDDLLFLVGEGNQGNLDLNGDSDADDEVMHLANLDTGVVTNLGLAGDCRLRRFHLDDGWFAFSVGERDQGDVDLNGDSDINDLVVFVGHVPSGTVWNIGVALWSLSPMALQGPHLGICARESDNGIDLNGDSDQNDQVFLYYNLATRTFTNTMMDASYFEWHSSGDALISLSEFGLGVDLNGDGDMVDSVWHMWDPVTGVFTNLGVDRFQQDAVIGATFAAYKRFESEELADLNSDGDMTDEVVSVRDLASGTVTNLGLATDGYLGLEGDLLTIAVYEWHQGQIDRNGDGDGFDRVGAVYDHTTGITTNIGISVESINIEQHIIAMNVAEFREGKDLNGDGDSSDYVFHTYDTVSTTLTNWKYATDLTHVWSDHGLIMMFADESASAQTLNGDGDRKDLVLFMYEVATGKLVNLRHAVLGVFNTSTIQVNAPRQVVMHVSELDQKADLNGDGDVYDWLLMRFQLR